MLWHLASSQTRVSCDAVLFVVFFKPYIHFLYLLNPVRGRGEAGAYHWVRGGVHHREKQDKQPCTLSLTPWVNAESPINPTGF